MTGVSNLGSDAAPDERSGRKVGALRTGNWTPLSRVKIPDSLALLGFRERRRFKGGASGPMPQAFSRRPQSSLPIATAVSAMRLEKPHSLSYQESTRTSLPSITFVWSMWNTDERLSWLKSQETLASVV